MQGSRSRSWACGLGQADWIVDWVVDWVLGSLGAGRRTCSTPTLDRMKPPAFKPQRLDVAAFAKAQGKLTGAIPVTELQRLSEGACPPADAPPDAVHWQATGLQRAVLGGGPQVRLRLQAQATVWLQCQRCLQPMPVELNLDRMLRFVRDEDEAAQLDEVTDTEDVLAMGRALDLMELVEDELIMALPIVPRHEACPQPLVVAHQPAPGKAAPHGETTDLAPSQGRPNPFAVLSTLKRTPSS